MKASGFELVVIPFGFSVVVPQAPEEADGPAHQYDKEDNNADPIDRFRHGRIVNVRRAYGTYHEQRKDLRKKSGHTGLLSGYSNIDDDWFDSSETATPRPCFGRKRQPVEKNRTITLRQAYAGVGRRRAVCYTPLRSLRSPPMSYRDALNIEDQGDRK